jgi:predicted solute-binding protein
MPAKPRVCAVGYLNTSPLVWGFLHGPQQGRVDLSFRVPAECADLLRSGQADVGIPPSIELASHPDWLVIPGCSISSLGPVASVVLVSRRPIEQIESVAADTSSRTSVALAHVLLARKYHRYVKFRPYPPRLPEMLDIADAALLIGDPALRLRPDPALHVYDLGAEWHSLTRLPMVYAVWVVRRPAADPELAALFQASARYGLDRLDEIVSREASPREIPADLARRYLAENIRFSFAEPERRGLSLFLEYAAELGLVPRRTSLETLDEPALAV